MKKISLILCLAMLLSVLSFVSCGKCEHEFVETSRTESTCTTKGEVVCTCELCGNTQTEELPLSDTHSYESKVSKEATYTKKGEITYTCSVCGDSFTEETPMLISAWEKAYYVDDFGDYTNDSYVRGEFHGDFSNSATNGSDLTVYVFYDDSITFRLLEYDSHKASFLSSDSISLKVKNSKGTVITFSLSEYDGDLYTFDSDLKSLIKTNEKLSCVITVSSKYSSDDTYRFSITNGGLSELLK